MPFVCQNSDWIRSIRTNPPYRYSSKTRNSFRFTSLVHKPGSSESHVLDDTNVLTDVCRAFCAFQMSERVLLYVFLM